MRVDVDRVLREKAPAADRWLPGFVKGYLRRIVHEQEVNRYLESFSHLPTIEFVRATLAEMKISYHSVGMEKLDRSGRYIFASNHPFGGVDGLMLADEVSSYFGDVRVVVNDILMNLVPLKPIFVPVNKHGRQRGENASLIGEAFASSIPMITFPAGLCSRREKGVVQDLQWRPNFIKQALKHQRDVVPVFFEGRLSNFFYRLSSLRKNLGIKANIEMLYLADEMFKQGGNHFEIRIGNPVPWQELEGEQPSEAAQNIRRLVYDLKK